MLPQQKCSDMLFFFGQGLKLFEWIIYQSISGCSFYLSIYLFISLYISIYLSTHWSFCPSLFKSVLIIFSLGHHNMLCIFTCNEQEFSECSTLLFHSHNDNVIDKKMLFTKSMFYQLSSYIWSDWGTLYFLGLVMLNITCYLHHCCHCCQQPSCAS